MTDVTPADLDRQVKDIRRNFHATLIAVAHHLETPFTDTPELTPWSGFVRPMIGRVDYAFDALLAAVVSLTEHADTLRRELVEVDDLRVEAWARASAAEAALAQAITDMTALCGEMDFWDARWAIEHCIDIVRVLQGRLDTNQETNHD